MKSKLVLPCLRGVIGDWVYYSSLMSAKQVHDWIKPAKDIRETKSLDEILQRDLKERRKKIAQYLLKVESRFFNSIVVGVFEGVPDWLEFDLTKTQELIGSNVSFTSLKESIGLIVFDGDEEMFAIDGQHRVAGIKIAYEEEKSKIEEKRVLNDDQFSVIFIAHIDDALGRKRTRKLFSDINNNAKPVSQGDRIKIDEESLNAIVTRRIYASYHYFQKGKIISLTESARLENNDTKHFTNLLGINSTNRILRKLFKKIPKTNLWDEENVIVFQKIVEKFYNFAILNIQDYSDYFIKKELSIEKARKNNSYLLFRPIGLKLIAGIYVHYFQKDDGLELLKKKINKISFVLPKSPFNNILWNNGKMEAKESNQRIALELAIYLLGDLPKQKENKFIENYRDLLKNPDAQLPEKVK